MSDIGPSPITQRELQRVNRLRDKLGELRDETKEVAAQLDMCEESIKRRIAAKAQIESGRWSALLETEAGACRPPWKELHQNHMVNHHEVHWDTYEAKVREEYPAGYVTRLVVSATK